MIQGQFICTGTKFDEDPFSGYLVGFRHTSDAAIGFALKTRDYDQAWSYQEGNVYEVSITKATTKQTQRNNNMSFSFTKHAATKHELQNLMEDAMADVVATQPVHKAHSHQILADLGAQLNVIAEAPEGQHYWASINGSISVGGYGDDGKAKIVSISHGVAVIHRNAASET